MLSLPRALAIRLLTAVLVVFLVIIGWRWWNHGRFVETTENAYVQADITVIAPKVAGYVANVAVGDNQKVHSGAVLLTIDPADYRAKLASAEAELERAQAAAVTLGVDAGRQQALIAQARSHVVGAQADMDWARRELLRYGQLQKDQFASVQRVERARADATRGAAALQEANAEATSAQRQLAVLNARQREALADVAAARATLEAARIDLDNCTIRAPIDGVVGNRLVRAGQYVRPGTQLLAVVPLDKVYVVANFKETQIESMKVGQRVEFHADAYPDVKLEGVVDSFSPASGALFSLLPPENATGNFTKIVQRVPVKIMLSGPVPTGMRLTPGMSVVASIDTRAGAGG